MASEQGGGQQQQTPEDTLKTFLEKNEGIIAQYLAKDSALDAKRLTKLALQVVNRGTDELRSCSRLSILDALCEAGSLGLEIGSTVLAHAYLVPRQSKEKHGREEVWVWKACLQVSVRGKLELARRSGLVLRQEVREICEGDDVVVELGTNPRIEHSLDFSKMRGAPMAYYAIAFFRDGSNQFEIMSRAECLRIRDTFSKAKAAWDKNEGEFCKKTVLHRLDKLLPLSPAQMRADEIDPAEDEDVVVAGRVVPVVVVPDERTGERAEEQAARPRSRALSAAQDRSIILPALEKDRETVVPPPAPVEPPPAPVAPTAVGKRRKKGDEPAGFAWPAEDEKKPGDEGWTDPGPPEDDEPEGGKS